MASVVEFQMSVDYNPHWSRLDALREIVSNGIDGEKCNPRAKFALSYKDGVLRVSNQSTKLAHSALVLGVSGSRDVSAAIGQFGEGLLMACLVLTRASVDFQIINADEQWEFYIEEGALGVEVLKMRAKPLGARAVKEADGRFIFAVHNVNETLFEELCNLFLVLQEPDRSQILRVGQNRILLEERHKGLIFVKGVRVAHYANLALGYEIPGLTMNRDRKTADVTELSRRIVDIYRDANDDVLEQVMPRAETEGTMERMQLAQYAPYGSLGGLSRYYDRKFQRDHGDAIPVVNMRDAELLRNYGRRAVVVNSFSYAFLTNKLADEELAQQRFKADVEILQLEDLTGQEQSVLSRARAALHSAGIDLGSFVIAVMEDRVLGMYSVREDQVYLSRKCLGTVEDCLETIIHECAHRQGGTREDGHHVATMMSMWKRLARHLLAAGGTQYLQ